MSDKLLMVGMPCYSCNMHIDACQSLIEMTTQQIRFQWVAIGNESLISRARNNIISYFFYHKEFSHLLFLDADIHLSGMDTFKLLESGKDVVGAAVRLKSPNVIYNFNSNKLDANNEPPKEDNYYKVDKLGTAVFMMSRKAVEDVVALAKSRGDVYDKNSILIGGSLADDMPSEFYDICKVGVKDKLYLSEDFYLCRDLRSLGYEIYVDRTIKTRHNGTMALE